MAGCLKVKRLKMINKQNLKIKVGGHVSISGGLDKAVQRAHDLGGNIMQVFSGSPRVWQRGDLAQIDLEELFTKQEKLGVESIIIHTSYLVNLASNQPELVGKSVRALIYDLKLNSLVKGSGVVVHLGSHQGRGWDAVKDQLTKKIKYILSKTPENSRLLIENSAGQKGKIASDLVEIRWLLDEINSSRLGWCLDICHAFAAGYPLVQSSKLVGKSNKPNLIAAITDLNLWSTLACLHINDSKAKFNTGNDRHENIGDGLIPQEDLKEFLNYPQVINQPLIIEVPGIAGKGPDQENIDRIKQLVGVI